MTEPTYETNQFNRHPDKYIVRDDGQFRVRIISAAGKSIGPGLLAADPPAAQKVMNQEGWCEYDALIPGEFGATNPRIVLDSGKVIWGYECWWEPILQEEETEEPDAPQ